MTPPWDPGFAISKSVEPLLLPGSFILSQEAQRKMLAPQIQRRPLSDHLQFGQATDAQIDEVWRLNADAWAAPLSVETHMARERFLSEQGLTNGGKWRTWIITLADSSEDIVASCETFEKDVLVRDGEGVRREKGYAIASVFTPTRHRGNGYSAVLLGKVAEWLDGLDGGKGAASVLYSDIGKRFYAKLGWDTFPSHQITLQPANLESGTEGEAVPGVRLLQQDDLLNLCDTDVANVARSMADQPPLGHHQARIAFLPTYLQACWHFSKEDFMGTQDNKVPKVKGAISVSGKVWVYWYHDITENKLKIQRVIVADRSDKDVTVAELALLLQQAAKEAWDWNIKEVVFWNPCEEVRLAAGEVSKSGAAIVKEEERMQSSIPCLRWKRGSKADVVWDCNEFYAWC